MNCVKWSISVFISKIRGLKKIDVYYKISNVGIRIVLGAAGSKIEVRIHASVILTPSIFILKTFENFDFSMNLNHYH